MANRLAEPGAFNLDLKKDHTFTLNMNVWTPLLGTWKLAGNEVILSLYGRDSATDKGKRFKLMARAPGMGSFDLEGTLAVSNDGQMLNGTIQVDGTPGTFTLTKQ